jgi:hypothetical protein
MQATHIILVVASSFSLPVHRLIGSTLAINPVKENED